MNRKRKWIKPQKFNISPRKLADFLFSSYSAISNGPDKLEVVASFCYLGDMLLAAGGCELSTTTRVKNAWKKSKELKPVLSSSSLSFKTCGRVYSTCVRSAMPQASDTWPVTKPCLQRLQRNDRATSRQICNVKPQDMATIRSMELLARLGIEDLDLILKERRLRWYGHVERSNSAVKTAFDIQGNGKRGPGRPKMTWKQLTERDRRGWKLSAIDPHDRDTWKSGVRSAMRAASQLPGRGPLLWIWPLYLHVNQKSDDDDGWFKYQRKWMLSKNVFYQERSKGNFLCKNLKKHTSFLKTC